MEVRESVLGVWSVSSVFCDVLRNFSNTDEHVTTLDQKGCGEHSGEHYPKMMTTGPMVVIILK